VNVNSGYAFVNYWYPYAGAAGSTVVINSGGTAILKATSPAARSL